MDPVTTARATFLRLGTQQREHVRYCRRGPLAPCFTRYGLLVEAAALALDMAIAAAVVGVGRVEEEAAA